MLPGGRSGSPYAASQRRVGGRSNTSKSSLQTRLRTKGPMHRFPRSEGRAQTGPGGSHDLAIRSSIGRKPSVTVTAPHRSGRSQVSRLERLPPNIPHRSRDMRRFPRQGLHGSSPRPRNRSSRENFPWRCFRLAGCPVCPSRLRCNRSTARCRDCFLASHFRMASTRSGPGLADRTGAQLTRAVLRRRAPTPISVAAIVGNPRESGTVVVGGSWKLGIAV